MMVRQSVEQDHRCLLPSLMPQIRTGASVSLHGVRASLHIALVKERGQWLVQLTRSSYRVTTPGIDV